MHLFESVISLTWRPKQLSNFGFIVVAWMSWMSCATVSTVKTYKVCIFPQCYLHDVATCDDSQGALHIPCPGIKRYFPQQDTSQSWDRTIVAVLSISVIWFIFIMCSESRWFSNFMVSFLGQAINFPHTSRQSLFSHDLSQSFQGFKTVQSCEVDILFRNAPSVVMDED